MDVAVEKKAAGLGIQLCATKSSSDISAVIDICIYTLPVSRCLLTAKAYQ